MIGLMNNEFKMMRNEGIVSDLKHYSGICLERLRERKTLARVAGL
jgi:hypothetical protein